MRRKTSLTAVFDCMIYLQAAISETGPAAELHRYAERANFTILVSEAILQELRDVISRPAAMAKYPHLTPEFVEIFLYRISESARSIRTVPARFAFPRDPKDEKYIDLAIHADADYIVSRDSDLLGLMTDHTDEAKEFRQRFHRLKIVDPVEFLMIVRDRELAMRP